MRLRPLSWSAVVITGAGAVDSIVASTAPPFTWRANVTTAVGIVGITLVGLAPAWRRRHAVTTGADAQSHDLPRSGAVAWTALAAAGVAFELANFFSNPRSQHPTISSLLDVLTGHEVLRGLLFAAWLWAGWWLWGRS